MTGEPGGSKQLIFGTICLVCILVAGAAFWYVQWRRDQGTGGVTVRTLLPLEGSPYFVAISPDGAAVSMIRGSGGGGPSVEVRDVASGREMGSFTLPAWKEGPQYSLARPLRYCDGGKYLVAFDGLGTLYVVDAQTFQPHGSIVLNDLQVRFGKEIEATPMSRAFSTRHFELDCSAGSAVMALRIPVDKDNAIKLVDLDTVSVTADLTESFRGFYGEGVAVSPDGSKVAVVTWDLWSSDRVSQEMEVVEVADIRSGSLLRTRDFGDRHGLNEYQLAFAGENALVIGEPLCQPNQMCRDAPAPRGRRLRVLDLGERGETMPLGTPGEEVYRFSGASADGGVVFAYTGAENFCKSCNHGIGELKIEDARFTVWNRNSGRGMVLSPRLRVMKYRCPLIFFGACEDSEAVPSLELSADGNSVVAFWSANNIADPNASKGNGEVKVFSWH